MADYSGFIQNPLEVVQRLRNDLGDRYKRGFPVLKELLQNADDAQASHVVFGLIPGITDAQHPLLKGDGLFVINNGGFEAKHDRGIRSYGTSNKVADRAAVGKFGLGMKSVFHFCEAFFFLGHTVEQGPIARFVNPWSVPNHLRDEFVPVHPSWETLTSEDAALMRKALTPIMSSLTTPHSESPFILWLPLRREAHRWEDGEDTGVIVQEFPGDGDGALAFLQEPALPMQVADLLPLLRHVKEIRFQPIGAGEFQPFSAEIDDDSQRLRFLTDPGEYPLRGEIRVQDRNGTGSGIRFFGRETYRWIEELRVLQEGRHWPETSSSDDRGRAKVEPEKAEPHAALVLTSAHGHPGAGTLTIRWAVFLPLDESLVSETVVCGGDQDYCFTLHGHFFVDAGRRGIHGFDVLGKGEADQPVDSVDAVRIGWNQQLATKGTLPLLLPVLQEYVEGLRTTQRDAIGRLLATALSDSGIWKRFRNDITTAGQWILGLGRTGPTWQLLDRGRALLPLPLPPEHDRERPWQVFPALHQCQETCDLVVAGAPQLSTNPIAVPNPASIEVLLQSVVVSKTLSQKAEIAYLADTLELLTEDGVLQQTYIRQQLAVLLREGLRCIGLKGIRANRMEVQRLVGFLPQDASLILPKSLPSSLLERLVVCSLTLLVMPSDLCPQTGENQTRLSIQDADILLRVIASWIQEAPEHGRNSMVLKEVARLAGFVNEASRASLFQSLRDLNLIHAFDGRANEWHAVSPRDIQQGRQASLLFRRGQVADDQGLALTRQLQGVLADSRVLVLEREILDLLELNDRSVLNCDAKGVLHALGSQSHALREASARRNLVRQLPDPGDDEAAKRGLRFLLHGKESRWNDLRTELWFRDTDEGTAWERLWNQLNEGWNLIDSELAQYVSDPVRRSLRVHRIRPRELLDSVAREGVAKIDPSAYTATECAEILTQTHDDVIWRMLPLHECTDKSRCDARGENVYLDTGLAASDDLRDQIRIIRRSSDDALWHRQKKLLQPFGHEQRLKVILNLARPERFVDDILSDIEALEGNLPFEISILIEGSTWIPGGETTAYKPSDIIDCNDPSGLIRDLAIQLNEGAYTFVDLLPRALLEHTGFRLVRERGWLAQGDAALKTLGLLIADLPDYHLGHVDVENVDFVSALPCLAGMSQRLRLPGWAMLESLTKDYDPAQIVTLVAREMARELDDELTIVLGILNWIVEQGQANEGRRAAFELYLRRFAELPGAGDNIAALRLIDSGGHWRSAGQLCAGAEDIERRFMLCESQYGILQRHLVSAGSLLANQTGGAGPTPPVTGAALAERLADFFNPWRDKVPEALIGCFILLCGSASETKALVEEYRGSRIGLRDWLLAKFPWAPPGYRNDGVKQWLFGKNLAEAIDSFTFSATIATDSKVTVPSLVGDPIEVKRALNAKTFVTVRGNDTEVSMQLAPVEVAQQSAPILMGMLQNSIRALVENWSMQKSWDLSALWAELESSDQIAIDVSRSLILDSLPILSTQLKLDRHLKLDEALKSFDDARARVVEFSGHERVSEYQAQKNQALEQIQHLIENDEAARTVLLAGVRSKIREYQYKPESIPFELFQNADDALRERAEIDEFIRVGAQAAAVTDPDYHRFLVLIAAGTVTFMHWGRPLNATGDPFPGRDHGYHRDLEKMLIIGASGKKRPATGKFGLGFKSVFLGCQEPHLVSARLSVKILGGMLPIQLNEDTQLRSLIREHAPAQGGAGTAIHLALESGSVSAMLDRFQAMAGVLCCFAKTIRHIEFIGETSHAWVPSALACAPALSVGSLTIPDTTGGIVRIQALRIGLGEGALLFRLDGTGIKPLPSSIPTLWILAPTTEDDALGFALNGPFEVDAGRTRLADSEEANVAIADALGRQLHQALEALSGGIEHDWDDARQALNLHEGVESYDFWYSLWQTLFGGLQVRDRSKVQALALRVAQAGLGTLGLSRALLPNGLPGVHRGLLRIGDVRLVLRGALSIPQVFESLCGWDRFADSLKPYETLCAQIHEWASLAHPAYANARAQWKSTTLADWVSRLMDDSQQVRVAPGPAGIWGGIFDVMKSDDLPKDQRADLDAAARVFSDALFLNATSRFSPAAELLMLDDTCRDAEERMRWAFAPNSHRLAADYDEAGRSLLRLSRGASGFSAGAQQLAQWILDLDEDQVRRIAALVYLRDGDRSSQVISKLRELELEGTWLAALAKDSPNFSGWRSEQILQLLTQFQSTEQWETLFQTPIDDPPPPRAVDVARTLEKIRDWWRDESLGFLVEYEQEVYPGGAAPADELRVEHEDFTGDRSAWLSLFLLGHFHTIGLVGHDQNRGFIEKCHQEGWWSQAFAKPDPQKNPDAWMGVLDEYIEAQTDQQTYEHWMQRFPAIYRLACYLDDYRDLMLGLPTWGWALGECRLDQVTKPRISPRLQGGGIKAPPFHKTLGIGACFVVRELLRLGVVAGENAPHACAYVPTKGVRDLLAAWGYPQFDGAGADVDLSKEIHRILVEHLTPEDARFAGAYDIPLQIMAYDPSIQYRNTVYVS